jgi:hypothetical protein
MAENRENLENERHGGSVILDLGESGDISGSVILDLGDCGDARWAFVKTSGSGDWMVRPIYRGS